MKFSQSVSNMKGGVRTRNRNDIFPNNDWDFFVLCDAGYVLEFLCDGDDPELELFLFLN